MPSRFKSGAYSPEQVKAMSEALEAAWAAFDPKPDAIDLARKTMADAIIRAAEDGEMRPAALADAATPALRITFAWQGHPESLRSA